ncbi:uncharacterized protein LOC126367091 [Pectinophora gossypiella]|uniref:Uncharacterized protein n=1 Tax=Pectinophora gossypiella TaxID=13191 RepID=A0A1E1W3D0_PECGO|nr:uncharacterized protein LOC126367091 [Pectinophora gossypiella]
MASESDDFDENIENFKSTVRKSFARVFAALKARELKTLRQLDALRKQCEDNKDLKRHCVQNIHINFDNESALLENVSSYGVIDFERLNFDSNTFTLEDYVSPNDDHMYSYKTIEDLTKEEFEDLEAIEEAALKEITRTDDCVCFVAIRTEDVAKKFRDINTSLVKTPCDSVAEDKKVNGPETEVKENDEEGKNENSDEEDVKKIDPTDDWLNSIKGQTETEPSQVTDVMEHSTITCS